VRKLGRKSQIHKSNKFGKSAILRICALRNLVCGPPTFEKEAHIQYSVQCKSIHDVVADLTRQILINHVLPIGLCSTTVQRTCVAGCVGNKEPGRKCKDAGDQSQGGGGGQEERRDR
jgi:hypothetical protein